MRFSYQKMTSNEQNKIELQTFEEHLDVLRKMLFRICCLSFILALGVFFLKDYVFTLLIQRQYNVEAHADMNTLLPIPILGILQDAIHPYQ